MPLQGVTAIQVAVTLLLPRTVPRINLVNGQSRFDLVERGRPLRTYSTGQPFYDSDTTSKKRCLQGRQADENVFINDFTASPPLVARKSQRFATFVMLRVRGS